MNEALGRLATIAGLAILTGVGVLAFKIGDTWTETTTQSMVTALATVCGGGAVVFALLVALIVGIPMATRYFAESGRPPDSGTTCPRRRGECLSLTVTRADRPCSQRSRTTPERGRAAREASISGKMRTTQCRGMVDSVKPRR